MNLSDLKLKSPQEIIELAESMGLEDISRKRKQELIFAISKEMMKNGEEISGEGTLELLPDGYGFLRSEINSYQASPDDIYVSPNLIRRCNLRTGDLISGRIRPPKDNERYFALNRITASILTMPAWPNTKFSLKT